MTAGQIRRFWSSAQREGECLVWAKSRRRNGYGQATIAHRNRTAHRLAFELTYGAIPEGMLVDHICGNRACIEPAHLRLATKKQNGENRVGPPQGRSGIRGVRWDSSRGCWSVALTHNYKTINLGRFADLTEAGRVAAAARAEIFTHSKESR